MTEPSAFVNKTVQKLQPQDIVDLQDFPPAGLYRVTEITTGRDTFFISLQALESDTARRLVLQRGFRLKTLKPPCA